MKLTQLLSQSIKPYVAIMGAIALLTACGKKPNSENQVSPVAEVAEHQVLEVLVSDDETLQFVYEGAGDMKSSTRSQDGFEIIAHRLPEGAGFEMGGLNDDKKFHVLDFRGKLELGKDDSVAIRGTIECAVPTTVRFIWMLEKGGDPKNEEPEKKYPKGRSEVNFEGKVVGWAESKKL